MPGGRPTDCTEEVIAACEEAALLGVTMRNLHKHAGVDAATFWRWMGATEGIQAKFRERIQKARNGRERRALTRGDEEGRVFDMWLLERSYGYRKDADSDAEPPAGTTARSREEAVEQLRKLPADLLLEALTKRDTP